MHQKTQSREAITLSLLSTILFAALLLSKSNSLMAAEQIGNHGFSWSSKSVRFVSRRSPKFKVHLKLPVISAAHIDSAQLTEANKIIMHSVNQKRSQLENQIYDSFDLTLKQSQSSYWEINCGFKIYTKSPTLLSIRLDFESMLGGAHQRIDIETLVLQFNPFKVLSIDDLFQANKREAGFAVLSKLSKETIIKTLKAEPDTGMKTWIIEGTYPIPDNFKKMIISEDGVILIFPPYQVAAFAHGIHDVLVPWKQLYGLLNGF